MPNAENSLHPRRRQILLVLLCVAALYIVVPQFGDFRASWQLVRHPALPYVAIAVVLTMATYLAGAATYCFLSQKRLPFGRTLVVQLAAMFMNRLLPAGVGALGANYVYLKNQRHSTAQATGIVALNNAVGFAGHGLLLVIVLLCSPSQSLAAAGQPAVPGDALKIIGVLAGLLVLAGLVWGWKRLERIVRGVLQQILTYRHHPLSAAGALLSSVTLTLCNVLCLMSCLLALGVHVPFAAILLVFTFGVGTGIATPTPGGLGGFEAGLAAGFVAYHVDNAAALAAALLYRLVSYWFPLMLGALAFSVCQRQKWLELSNAKH